MGAQLRLLFILCSFYGCKSDYEINIKKGTYRTINDDSSITFIYRDQGHQYEYSPGNTERNKLSRIRWKTNRSYEKEVLNIKSPFDTLLHFVKINKVAGNTYFETTQIEGTQLQYYSEVVKINDDVDNMLANMLREYNKKGDVAN